MDWVPFRTIEEKEILGKDIHFGVEGGSFFSDSIVLFILGLQLAA